MSTHLNMLNTIDDMVGNSNNDMVIDDTTSILSNCILFYHISLMIVQTIRHTNKAMNGTMHDINVLNM